MISLSNMAKRLEINAGCLGRVVSSKRYSHKKWRLL